MTEMNAGLITEIHNMLYTKLIKVSPKFWISTNMNSGDESYDDY